jgi:hypothetical protein
MPFIGLFYLSVVALQTLRTYSVGHCIASNIVFFPQYDPLSGYSLPVSHLDGP